MKKLFLVVFILLPTLSACSLKHARFITLSGPEMTVINLLPEGWEIEVMSRDRVLHKRIQPGDRAVFPATYIHGGDRTRSVLHAWVYRTGGAKPVGCASITLSFGWGGGYDRMPRPGNWEVHRFAIIGTDRPCLSYRG